MKYHQTLLPMYWTSIVGVLRIHPTFLDNIYLVA